MHDMQIFVWFFPLLFIFHDFEEIILMRYWIDKNESKLQSLLPSRLKPLFNRIKKLSTAAFAFGVAQEYLLILLISTVSFFTHWYDLWIGCFIAFLLHLFFHLFQAFFIKSYIPGLLTSLISIVISILLLFNIWNFFEPFKIFIYSLLGFVLMMGNLIFIHFLMERLDRKWNGV